MNAKLRWAISLAIGFAAVPAGYAASVVLCAPSALANLSTLAALVLIP